MFIEKVIWKEEFASPGQDSKGPILFKLSTSPNATIVDTLNDWYRRVDAQAFANQLGVPLDVE